MAAHYPLVVAMVALSVPTALALLGGESLGSDGQLHRHFRQRAVDPKWDGKNVQAGAKYGEDYPHDRPDQSAAPAAAAASADDDDWFTAESGRINEECQKKHERLEILRRQKAQADVNSATHKLQEEEKKLKDKEDALGQQEKEIDEQEKLVQKEVDEAEKAKDGSAEAKGKALKKKDDLNSKKQVVAERRKCAAKLKQAEQELANAQQALAKASAGATTADHTAHKEKQDVVQQAGQLESAQTGGKNAAQNVDGQTVRVEKAQAKLDSAKDKLADVRSTAHSRRCTMLVAAVASAVALLVRQP